MPPALPTAPPLPSSSFASSLPFSARPLLIPGVAQSWRGPRTLQLGADPARAVLIDLPDPRAAGLLPLLDGTRPLRVILRQAAEHGLSPGDATGLIDTLRASGYVVAGPHLHPPGARFPGEAAALALADPPPARPPAETLRARAAARVVVAGAGRLGIPIAVALAEAGVGHVHPGLTGPIAATDLPGSPLSAADVGSPRAATAPPVLRRAVPTVETRPLRRRAPTVVVQLGHDQPVALLAAAHRARRRPHLAVGLREGVAAVGPFVPARGRPCLLCIDLTRRERDPDWRDFLPTAEPAAVTTVLTATAYAVAEVLTVIDQGTPQTLGATVEITGPGRFRRRSWHPHPDCPCTRTRR